VAHCLTNYRDILLIRVLLVYIAKDAPPSYNDVMGISQLRKDIGAAKEESNNPAVMLFKICCVCTGSCRWFCVANTVSFPLFFKVIFSGLVILLFGALPISLLVVGEWMNCVIESYLFNI